MDSISSLVVFVGYSIKNQLFITGNDCCSDLKQYPLQSRTENNFRIKQGSSQLMRNTFKSLDTSRFMMFYDLSVMSIEHF